MNTRSTVSLSSDLIGLDWSEAARVFELAPLGTREPEKLRRGFENSQRVCIAKDDQRLIGLARAITDFEYQAAVYDLVLLPDYQGQGLGRKMMDYLLDDLTVQSVILFAAPGKEPFYDKLGFIKMNTAMGRFDDPERVRKFGLI